MLSKALNSTFKGHSFEFFKTLADVLFLGRVAHSWFVVAGEVDDKAFANLIREPFIFE